MSRSGGGRLAEGRLAEGDWRRGHIFRPQTACSYRVARAKRLRLNDSCNDFLVNSLDMTETTRYRTEPWFRDSPFTLRE